MPLGKTQFLFASLVSVHASLWRGTKTEGKEASERNVDAIKGHIGCSLLKLSGERHVNDDKTYCIEKHLQNNENLPLFLFLIQSDSVFVVHCSSCSCQS